MTNSSLRCKCLVGLLGVCAVVLGSPRVVEAAAKSTGVVADPPVTVMPSPDPWIYTISPTFVPYDNPPVNPTVQEYFAPGDYFTITGFGTIISLKGLTFADDNFSLTEGMTGGTELKFTYDAGAPNLFSAEAIATIEIDATMLPPLGPDQNRDLVFTYVDHLLKNGTDSVVDNPTDDPNYGPNLEPVTVVPEPSSIALLALGTLGGLYFRRRAARRRA